MTAAEKDHHGINTALSHTDLMISDQSTRIEATCADGQVIVLMENGLLTF